MLVLVKRIVYFLIFSRVLLIETTDNAVKVDVSFNVTSLSTSINGSRTMTVVVTPWRCTSHLSVGSLPSTQR